VEAITNTSTLDFCQCRRTLSDLRREPPTLMCSRGKQGTFLYEYVFLSVALEIETRHIFSN